MLNIPKSLTSSLQKSVAHATSTFDEIKQFQSVARQKIHGAIDSDNQDSSLIDNLVKDWKLICKLTTQIEQATNDLKSASSALFAIDAINAVHETPLTPAPSINPLPVVPTPATPPKAAPSPLKKTTKVASKKESKPKIAVSSNKAVATPASAATASAEPASSVTLVSTPEDTQPKLDINDLKGNSDKLMRYFETKLNPNSFTLLTQTSIAEESQIPLGSLTALLKKLCDSGLLIMGPSNAMKLGKTRKAVPPEPQSDQPV